MLGQHTFAPRPISMFARTIAIGSMTHSNLCLMGHLLHHPTRSVPHNIKNLVHFTGKIQVFHSATTQFHAPSDLCGAGRMYRQHIRCNPSWYGHPCQDTVFVVEDEDQPGMAGMLIARLRLLFSFVDAADGEVIPCALVSWFVPAQEECDPETRMWTVEPEGTWACRPVQVSA